MGLSALGTVAATSTTASAMPMSPPAISSSNAEQVRYVCNEWGRCWWRPNHRYYGYYGYGPRYYAPRYYGPRFYGGYGGWHRGWGYRW
jgi:hypothetical protein